MARFVAMRDVDQRLHELTVGQQSLVTSAQARALGVTRHGLTRRLDRGGLVRVAGSVLAVGGAAASPLQRLLARVLDAGDDAALSHTTALAHWGVRGFLPEPIHVVRHRNEGDHPVRGATVHEVRYLPRQEVRTLDDVRVVSPALALLQVAGMRSISDDRLARAIDAAWSDRLVSYETLHAIDRHMARQGRTGLVRFRALVEERGPEYTPPASNLEARFEQILRRAGLPPMRRQVDTGGSGSWIGRVDFRADDVPLVVEVQSERFHRGLTAERADQDRLDALERAGFEVLEVTDLAIYHQPAIVVADVATARVRAASRVRAARRR